MTGLQMTKSRSIALLIILIGGLGLARVVSYRSMLGAVLIAAASFLYFTYGKGGHGRTDD